MRAAECTYVRSLRGLERSSLRIVSMFRLRIIIGTYWIFAASAILLRLTDDVWRLGIYYLRRRELLVQSCHVVHERELVRPPQKVSAFRISLAVHQTTKNSKDGEGILKERSTAAENLPTRRGIYDIFIPKGTGPLNRPRIHSYIASMIARPIAQRAVPANASWSSRATMPLTAKITNPAFRTMATKVDESQRIRSKKSDDPEDVLFGTLYGLRTVELNRPKKLNSLNGSMCRKIVPRLQEWAKSDMANVIVLKGAGEKAFCAGGDVAELAQQNMTGEKGQKKSADYFGLEYKLDHLIATSGKPLVAFMDGITMGGGVGLSMHTPFRIATEKTVFAMPETTIGFFPDVGASFFLPKMDGAVGTYLALTSERLNGVNAFYAGIATHYLHSTSLSALESRLAELRFPDDQPLESRLEVINGTIEEFTTGLPHDQPMLLAGTMREAIDRCFNKNSVPEILAALEAETGETAEWAQKTHKTLHQRSPTSVYVTLRQMRLGKDWSIKETFQREYHIAEKFMKHPDFTEGVSALLIRKPKPGQPRQPPKWQPASLEDIKPEDNIAEPFFEVEGLEKLQLFTDSDYTEYPHARFSLPSEKSVERFVKSEPRSRKAIVREFVERRGGKQGIKEIVEEMLARKTQVQDGKAIWKE